MIALAVEQCVWRCRLPIRRKMKQLTSPIRACLVADELLRTTLPDPAAPINRYLLENDGKWDVAAHEQAARCLVLTYPYLLLHIIPVFRYRRDMINDWDKSRYSLRMTRTENQHVSRHHRPAAMPQTTLNLTEPSA
jgi:hypothetical protein